MTKNLEVTECHYLITPTSPHLRLIKVRTQIWRYCIIYKLQDSMFSPWKKQIADVLSYCATSIFHWRVTLFLVYTNTKLKKIIEK